MAGKPNNKNELSKHVLQMKFMKRTAVKLAAEEKTFDHVIDADHWQLAMPVTSNPATTCKFITEPSYRTVGDLLPGRQSFKGFNPEIERLAASIKLEQEAAEIDRHEAENSISDREMTERFTSVVGTISKKFATKRKKNAMIHEESSSNAKQTKTSSTAPRKQTNGNKHKRKSTDSPTNVKPKRTFLKPQD